MGNQGSRLTVDEAVGVVREAIESGVDKIVQAQGRSTSVAENMAELAERLTEATERIAKASERSAELSERCAESSKNSGNTTEQLVLSLRLAEKLKENEMELKAAKLREKELLESLRLAEEKEKCARLDASTREEALLKEAAVREEALRRDADVARRDADVARREAEAREKDLRDKLLRKEAKLREFSRLNQLSESSTPFKPSQDHLDVGRKRKTLDNLNESEKRLKVPTVRLSDDGQPDHSR